MLHVDGPVAHDVLARQSSMLLTFTLLAHLCSLPHTLSGLIAVAVGTFAAGAQQHVNVCTPAFRLAVDCDSPS